LSAFLINALTLSTPAAAADDLVSVVAARDVAALGRVYDEHQAALCSFCHRLIGERQAAEDLVHDVFVSLPDLIGKLEPGRSLRAFLLSIAANRAKHHLRSAARRRKLAARYAEEPRRSVTTPDREAERRYVAERIALALDQLSHEHRVTFVLAELEGHDAAGIGAILSIPEATVRTRLFHARRKLRSLLAKEGLP
jgi:RNA polymerase sigma-70 factor (ECF subfamily)